uniref:Uncharacterized protein n=1 Tax=Takifugu rubripes TaxID=31033 RepID=A0A674P9T0_TAKRU
MDGDLDPLRRAGACWVCFSCCFQGNDTPEITHCHDNINSVLDIMFTELVDELDLSEEHRANMFLSASGEKWQIYCSQKKMGKIIHRISGQR